MKSLLRYRSVVGVISVLSGLLAAWCMVVGADAVEYNFDAFSDPVLVLQYAHNYKAAYWFLLLDLAGYYLLLLPVILYLHKQYEYRSPWNTLFTYSGLAYVTVGAIGAAMLAATWPPLMQDYLAAPEAQKATIAVVFKAVTLLVTGGLWNILEVLFAAVWWIGVGSLLYSERKALGVVTIITGISTLLDSMGNIFSAPMLAETGLNLYLVLGIVWPVWIGIFLVRKTQQEGLYTAARRTE